MARIIGLHSTPWLDAPLEQLAQRASEWGYQALELEAGGAHLPLAACAEDSTAALQLTQALAEHEIQICSLALHNLGHVVGAAPDARHQTILPNETWGDGVGAHVRQRAVDAVLKAIQLSARLGASLLVGFTGSPLERFVLGFPPPTRDQVHGAWTEFSDRWRPILDACQQAGVRFALHLHASQPAFDAYSAEMALDALGGREEFGFALDPATLHWQGVDPATFVRRFPDRIFQVRITDAAVTLSGSSGILGSHLPPGDTRRGWEYRSPGRGGVDWETLFRALQAARYAGPLVVDSQDAAMDRDASAAEAHTFVSRLDFEPSGPDLHGAFT